MLGRALTVWVLLLIIAMVAGELRARLFEARLGEQKAHVTGTIAVIVIFALVIWLLVTWISPRLRLDDLAVIGLLWVALTVAFEFGFGHYVMGNSWTKLFADYDITAGRLWPLVLLTLLLWPVLAGLLRRGPVSP